MTRLLYHVPLSSLTVQQWKQLKTQAGDFFSSVTKTKPPNKTLGGYNGMSESTQQVSPPEAVVHPNLNGTFTKDSSPEELKAATKTTLTQPSATPVHSSNMAQKYVPISSYQMTPIQDDHCKNTWVTLTIFLGCLSFINVTKKCYLVGFLESPLRNFF